MEKEPITVRGLEKLKEGKVFGQKIRLLEEIWLNNSFKISNKEIDNVFGN